MIFSFLVRHLDAHFSDDDIFASSCALLMAHWPILQPTCGPIEDQRFVGRVFNSEENREKYLSYVEEVADILEHSGIVEDRHRYGEIIAGYVMNDPMAREYESVEDYKRTELTEENSGYNAFRNPILSTLRVRLGEVRAHFDAIANNALPRDRQYDTQSKCPDWRNPGVDYFYSPCAINSGCYGHDPYICGIDGEFTFPACKTLVPPSCGVCFPYSRCGSAELVDGSEIVVPSPTCGPERAAECAPAAI